MNQSNDAAIDSIEEVGLERKPSSARPSGWTGIAVYLALAIIAVLSGRSVAPVAQNGHQLQPTPTVEFESMIHLPLVQRDNAGTGRAVPTATFTPGPPPEPTPTPCSGTPVRYDFGGVNYPVSYPDPAIGEMGFGWIKVFSGPDQRYPYNTLRRIDVNYRLLSSLDNIAFQIGQEAERQAGNIEAWEIGNEVNLGASFGWDQPPDAALYTEILCAVYPRIKSGDPDVVVVSAGLAPTGRVPAIWEGHQGYCAPELDGCIGYYQDDHEFLREMLDYGAGDCFDALGYHPYGFGAPYDAALGSEECGGDAFCFRGVEEIRRIMVDEYDIDKPIWVTEFGWMVDPREERVGRPECWEQPSITQFHWQVVSPEEQALNVRGAFEYAQENYPWMGPMFLFNYGFYDGESCDHMGFFDIKGLPAEELFRALAGGCPLPELEDE